MRYIYLTVIGKLRALWRCFSMQTTFVLSCNYIKSMSNSHSDEVLQDETGRCVRLLTLLCFELYPFWTYRIDFPPKVLKHTIQYDGKQ